MLLVQKVTFYCLSVLSVSKRHLCQGTVFSPGYNYRTLESARKSTKISRQRKVDFATKSNFNRADQKTLSDWNLDKTVQSLILKVGLLCRVNAVGFSSNHSQLAQKMCNILTVSVHRPLTVLSSAKIIVRDLILKDKNPVVWNKDKNEQRFRRYDYGFSTTISDPLRFNSTDNPIPIAKEPLLNFHMILGRNKKVTDLRSICKWNSFSTFISVFNNGNVHVFSKYLPTLGTQ